MKILKNRFTDVFILIGQKVFKVQNILHNHLEKV